MTCTLSPATESRLVHIGADPAHAAELLSESEAAVVAMYLKELSEVEADCPQSITATGQVGQCNELLSRAKVAGKQLEEARERRVRPLVAEQRNVNALYKSAITRLEGLSQRLADMLVGWQRAEERRVAREREEAAAAALKAAQEAEAAQQQADAAGTEAAREDASAKAEQAQAAADLAEQQAARLVAPTKVKTQGGTTSIGTEWAFRVERPDDVPREFCSPDEKKLRAAVVGLGKREIAGVEIFERAKTRHTGAR